MGRSLPVSDPVSGAKGGLHLFSGVCNYPGRRCPFRLSGQTEMCYDELDLTAQLRGLRLWVWRLVGDPLAGTESTQRPFQKACRP
jgi:hypothetical protein